MSVNNGQPVDAPTTNSAFVSRLAAATDLTGVFSLLSVLSASGPTISNLQASVNSSELNIQTLAALNDSDFITISEKQGRHVIFVSGNAAPITMLNTVFGAAFAGLDGTAVTLIGMDDTNTVLLLFNDASSGALLNGSATLGKGESITLVWSTTLDRWAEASRSF